MHPTTQTLRTLPAQHCILQPGSLNFDPYPESPHRLPHTSPIPTPRSSPHTPPPGSRSACLQSWARTPLQPHSACLPDLGLRPRAAAPQAQAHHPLTPDAHVLQPKTLRPHLCALHPPRPSSLRALDWPATKSKALHPPTPRSCTSFHLRSALSPSLVPSTLQSSPRTPCLSLQPCRARRHHPGPAPPPA